MAEQELLDYAEEDHRIVDNYKTNNVLDAGYVGVHSASFKDFHLKEELQNVIKIHGFEHPSEVQHQCIPLALNGRDIICQAKSGMGKTAVFVLSILHMLKPDLRHCQALVLTHTRELSIQIYNEFKRFAKELSITINCCLGGEPLKLQEEKMKDNNPGIVVGAPGKILYLVESKQLELNKVEFFVLDECDKMLQNIDMRTQVQGVFKKTPHNKQVMMFSATLPCEMRPICLKFTKNPMEIYVDDQAKLTLHGLLQHYVNLSEEKQKNRKLFDLLDNIDFNQVIIFVKSQDRAEALAKILNAGHFPTAFIHGHMKQSDRVDRFEEFKNYGKRILVSTDLMGRGIDINKVNIVINYDLPPLGKYNENDITEKSIAFDRAVDQYLHRIGRAGRFGTKGLAITFVSSPDDAMLLNKEKLYKIKVTLTIKIK
jgi:ATP-dependent RNA helicase UAP56/SUB2